MPRNYSVADTIKIAQKKYFEKNNFVEPQQEEATINKSEEILVDLHILDEEKESLSIDCIQQQTDPESIKKEKDKGFLKSLFDWFK